MKILILGGDGYLGWPTSLYFSARGHDVYVLDNFVKKKIELENGIKSLIRQLPLIERLKLWNSNNKNQIKFIACDLLNHRFFLLEVAHAIGIPYHVWGCSFLLMCKPIYPSKTYLLSCIL